MIYLFFLKKHDIIADIKKYKIMKENEGKDLLDFLLNKIEGKAIVDETGEYQDKDILDAILNVVDCKIVIDKEDDSDKKTALDFLLNSIEGFVVNEKDCCGGDKCCKSHKKDECCNQKQQNSIDDDMMKVLGAMFTRDELGVFDVTLSDSSNKKMDKVYEEFKTLIFDCIKKYRLSIVNVPNGLLSHYFVVDENGETVFCFRFNDMISFNYSANGLFEKFFEKHEITGEESESLVMTFLNDYINEDFSDYEVHVGVKIY